MKEFDWQEKPGLKARIGAKLRSGKLAAAAALGVGVAAVTAVPEQLAAADVGTTTLQGIAADWGMSVPSIFILAAFLIALIAVIGGWARTQMGYYVVAGLGVIFLIMTYLGI